MPETFSLELIQTRVFPLSHRAGSAGSPSACGPRGPLGSFKRGSWRPNFLSDVGPYPLLLTLLSGKRELSERLAEPWCLRSPRKRPWTVQSPAGSPSLFLGAPSALCTDLPPFQCQRSVCSSLLSSVHVPRPPPGTEGLSVMCQAHSCLTGACSVSVRLTGGKAKHRGSRQAALILPLNKIL